MHYIPVVDVVTVTRDSPTAATLLSVPPPLTMSWAVTLYTPEGRSSMHPIVNSAPSGLGAFISLALVFPVVSAKRMWHPMAVLPSANVQVAHSLL